MKLLEVFLLVYFVTTLVEGRRVKAKPHFPTIEVTKNGFPIKGGVSSHIVGGSLASITSYPWQASLIMTKPYNATSYGYTLCGGSLIHPQWVISAAHCTINAVSIRVRLGSANYSTGGVYFDVSNSDIFTNSAYNPSSLANDVGLVRLPSPVSTTASIQPIALATISTPLTTLLTVSGWGRTCTNCAVSQRLLYASVRAISNNECTNNYGTTYVTPNTICTKAQTTTSKQSPCFGDSGGPLVKTDGTSPLLVGVVSFVSSVGCDSGGNVPAGYMRAAIFCSWIKTYITAADFTC